MEETLHITYTYTFTDGKTRTFPLVLIRETLDLLPEASAGPPAWAELDHHRCDICSLDPTAFPHCPIASNLAQVVDAFKDCFAYESVQVVVTTRERTYAKMASVQEGLSALIGIIMTTSGCPVMERLKPMVRFHLPFADLTETSYRLLAMYLIAQLYRHRRGEPADLDLLGLETIYRDVERVNEHFAKRILSAARKDANVNAMVNLDCFAKMVPFAVEELLLEMETYFAALLQVPS